MSRLIWQLGLKKDAHFFSCDCTCAPLIVMWFRKCALYWIVKQCSTLEFLGCLLFMQNNCNPSFFLYVNKVIAPVRCQSRGLLRISQSLMQNFSDASDNRTQVST